MSKALFVVCAFLFMVAFKVDSYAGNTINTATELKVDGTKTGKFYCADEWNYFKFTLAQDCEINIEALIYFPYAEFYIVDKDDFPIWYNQPLNNDDPFRAADATENKPVKGSCTMILPKGTYWIRIAYDSYFEIAGNFNFGITATYYDTCFHYGDSYDSPMNCNWDSGAKGLFTYYAEGLYVNWYDQIASTSDWYIFTINKPGKYQLLTNNNSSVRYKLYDSNYDIVKIESDGTYSLSPGKYKLYVYQSFNRIYSYYAFHFIRKIPPKGSQWQDGKLEYKITKSDEKNGTAKVTGLYKYVSTVSIPKTITCDGVEFKVTEVDKDAFSNYSCIAKVKIGDNVKKIGDRAFYGCKKMSSLSIGKSVKTIGKSAFESCNKLKTITIISKELKSSGIRSKAFSKGYKKPTITVPKSKYSSYKKLLINRGISKNAKFKKKK